MSAAVHTPIDLAGTAVAMERQTMEAVVPGYLQRFQPHGQFAHYRG